MKREVKIGVFGVSMVVLLYLGINFIKSRDIFSGNHTYYAVYDRADGIEASSPVVIRGYRVGTVERVRFDMPMRKVVVEFSVEKAYGLPRDSEARISSQSLLGSKVIEIQLGGAAGELLHGGDTLRAVVEPDLIEFATNEYGSLKARAESLVNQLSLALARVNEVLSEQNVAALSGTLAHLNSITGRVDRIVQTDLAATMANLTELSAILKQVAPKLDVAADRVVQAADSLPPLVRGAGQAVDELNVTLAAINNADGTVGQLIHQDTLMRNMNQAVESLTALLEDLKANPGRYVHVSVFGGKKNK